MTQQPTRAGRQQTMTTFKPTEGKNKNCMEGRVCPKCGNEDRLWVWAKIQLEMTDGGTSDVYADHEYDGDAPTECPECGFKAPLSVFDGQPEPRFPVGTRFKKLYGKNVDEYVVVDYHETKALSGRIVKTAYVAITKFAGQDVYDYDVPEATIVRGLIDETC